MTITHGRPAKASNPITWPVKAICHADRDRTPPNKAAATRVDPVRPVMRDDDGMGFWIKLMFAKPEVKN